MFEITLSTLAPIFLIIGLGWALRRGEVLTDGFFAGLNTLVFYIGLPALLVAGIATSTIEAGPAWRVFQVLLATTTVLTLIAYLVAGLFKLGGPATGSFVQAAMRGNLAYIGLPVVFFALDSPSGAYESVDIRAAAMLVLAPTVPIYNFACVVILAHGARAEDERPSIPSLALKVAANPLLLACLLGLAIALSGFTPPVTAMRTLTILGQMALPLALLSIGASFSRTGHHRQIVPALGASLIKVGAAPLLGLLAARWLALSPLETRMALLFLACPTAVTGYIMAQKMGADAELAGSAIVASTLLCILPLGLILWLV